jgi:hypothetical protein
MPAWRLACCTALEPIINVIALPLHDHLFDRHLLRKITAFATPGAV